MSNKAKKSVAKTGGPDSLFPPESHLPTLHSYPSYARKSLKKIVRGGEALGTDKETSRGEVERKIRRLDLPTRQG